MVMGGIPFYLSLLKPDLSLAQNIDALFFAKDGILRNEYQNLYSSLFKNSERHVAVIEALSLKTKGLTRDEIIKNANLPNGGGSTKVLDELESNGFIRKYQPFEKLSRESLYQLTDFYSNFYFKFVKNKKSTDENYWMNTIDNPTHRAWCGFAFEQVCQQHIKQIKDKLGIGGVHTNESSWRSKDVENPVQIDLLIERRDQVVNLCEMKFSINEFTIDKAYSTQIRNKIGKFKNESKTRKAVYFTMITTYGTVHNEYFNELVQKELTMDVLFLNIKY
jgi:predicted transcriptional regulator